MVADSVRPVKRALSGLAAILPIVAAGCGSTTGSGAADPASPAPATGLDLQKDTLAAVGDVGLFVRGSTQETLAGALVVRSPKPAVLAGTIARLPALIAGTIARLPALIATSARARVKVALRNAGVFDLTAAHGTPLRAVLGLR